MSTVVALPTTPADTAKSAQRKEEASFVAWFEAIGRGDNGLAGGKGANLGELTHAGLPVPAGFVVTVDAFREFLQHNNLTHTVNDALRELDLHDGDRLNEVAADLQGAIGAGSFPDAVCEAVAGAYEKLAQHAGRVDEYVAVRSSATAEDSAHHSFAGMFESYLNVHGRDDLLGKVRECWASAFGARVLYYRLRQSIDDEALVAVVVQRMIDAEKAGVMFTVNPATNDAGTLVIEAAYGLGEVVVSGAVTPDRYVVQKSTRRLLECSVGLKAYKLTRDEARGATKRTELTADDASSRVLDADEVAALCDLGIRAEQHYGTPQDLEWAIERGQIFVLQTRPITTLLNAGRSAPTLAAAPVLVRGLAASPGIAVGVTRLLLAPADGAQFSDGEILVAAATTPDWVPLMRRAGAIVTDAGGMTSHAAIVSRELGVPCIVGTQTATKVLPTGLDVTVNAFEGNVLAGRVRSEDVTPAPTAGAGAVEPATGTRVLVNLAEPDRARAVAALSVDGVGLLRAEFMIMDALDNVHPRALLAEGRGEEFVNRLVEKLVVFTEAFQPRPVIYRALDFKSNEFRSLKGGDRFEPLEANPMIGYRGCYRYVSEPELFALELKAIRRVRERFHNLHLMIPFVRTGSEFRACKRLIDESGLGADAQMQLWVMAEVPSVITWMEEYVRLGVTGVSIGSNDLTQLVLGVDRDSAIVAPLFDERDPAVLELIHRIIEEAHRLGITCSICGQAPSVYPDFVAALVEWGVDSISVNPDAVPSARRNIAAAEQRLLLAAARDRVDGRRTDDPTRAPCR